MTVSNNEENDAGSVPFQGPGSQLRKARKRQGLEQPGVAAQLHLQSSIIEALEADDYERLPGPVFVQGYLRNYARLLGVNEDAVIESYQRLLPESDEKSAVSGQESKPSKPLHSGHGIMRLMTWGILLVLAAMLFFWWQTRAELEEPLPLPTEEQSMETPPDYPDTPPEVVPSLPQEEAAPAMIPEAVPPMEEIEQPATFEMPPVTEQTAPVIEQLEPEPQPVDETIEPPVAGEPPEERIAQPVSPQPEVEPVAATSKTLLFEFSGACWTEVRDQAGKARIIGEMRSGSARRLSGQYGPFNVVLGDASVVRLTVDGQPFDLKPFTRGKVARFTLDPAQM